MLSIKPQLLRNPAGLSHIFLSFLFSVSRLTNIEAYVLYKVSNKVIPL